MSGRDANQLAADVRHRIEHVEGLLSQTPFSDADKQHCAALLRAVLPEADELVGLVGTLQQERDALEGCDCIPCLISSAACGKCGRRGVVSGQTLLGEVKRANEAEARAEAAEAALAAAQESLEVARITAQAEAEDADHYKALLATTRQALTDMTEALPQSWDWYVNHARRALAATDSDTEDPA